MYCPRCGHQTIADELRFCSYCGLKLGVVKAAIAESEDAPTAPATSNPTITRREPRHRDINLGVILMFITTLFATFTSLRLLLDREVVAVILGICYFALVFLSGPILKGIHKLLSWEEPDSANRKGFVFGSTLMLISTVPLAIISLFTLGRMRTTPFFVGFVLAFALLLLLGRHLMRGLKYLLQDEPSFVQTPGTPNQTPAVSSSFDSGSLAPAPGVPVSLFGAQRVTTAEIIAPSSITEHTTNLLENK